MRIIYLGTPALAVPALRFLAESEQVVAVITAPDRPRGRSGRPAPSPVKLAASGLGLKVLTPTNLREEGLLAELAALRPDLLITFAYGRLLPPAFLALARRRAVNVHPSLLPCYRGPAPIQRAIWAGERETGLTLIEMVAELDAGPILWQRPVMIPPAATYGEMAEVLGQEAVVALGELLQTFRAGDPSGCRQAEELATYAPLIRPEDERLDLSHSATALANQVRALSPEPGASLILGDLALKVLRAAAQPGSGRPGEVLGWRKEEGVLLGTGVEVLALQEVKPSGSRNMSAAAFWAGYAKRLQSPRKGGADHGEGA